MGTKTKYSRKTTMAALERKQKESPEETRYRIYSVLSYVFVLVAIGLPVWWLTTRVYRASLPLARMRDATIQNESNPHIPLPLEYDVLITIVHPDPTSLKIDLKGKELSKVLRPYLQPISPIANFTIKSQWLYLTELGVIPRKYEDHYALQEEQLPHVITPLEKKLFSHMSKLPCLNLVLYMTPCRTPLFIYDKYGKRTKTNTFTSPRWGGVYIMNPPKQSCELGEWKPDHQLIVSTVIAQIYKLLNVPQNHKKELSDVLLKQRVIDMVDSTRRTLRSLAQLLSEISNIVISDEVAQQINDAVENADRAMEILDNLKNGNRQAKIKEALWHSQKAYVAAETAFSDPSLLALLYFPDDQKYAIYIPLFLPVMIPVCMSLVTVKKWYFTGSLDNKK